MELRNLRYLVALADTLNFTRAAERVHVTQSTLSHQIRKLEQEIGYALFDRAGKHVALTEAGRLFRDRAANALREVDLGLVALKQGAAAGGPLLRLGATHTINLAFLPQCVAAFFEQQPGARVVVDELSADAIRAGLETDALDLGFAYRPTGPSELRFQPLRTEEMVLAVAVDHPLATKKRVRMVELDRQPLVLLPRSFATRSMLDECFRSAGADPVVCAEMNTIAPMLELVASTRIATIVAADAVPRPNARLVTVPLSNPTPVRIPGVLRKKGAEMTPAVRAFLEIVRKRAEAPRPRKRRAAA